MEIIGDPIIYVPMPENKARSEVQKDFVITLVANGWVIQGPHTFVDKNTGDEMSVIILKKLI